VFQVLVVSLFIFTLLAIPGIVQSHNLDRLQDPHATWGPSLRLTLFSYWLDALVVVPVFFLARKFPLHEKPYWRPLLLHAVLLFGWMVFFSASRSLVFRLLWIPASGYDMSFHAVLSRVLHMALMQWIWMYAMVALGVYAVQYYARLRQRELAEAHLRTQLAQSELEVLKLQLHPHFLFNCLNGISALMSSDVLRARTMIAQLSDLLRAALKRSDAEVPISEELSFVDAYVDLQRMRLGERFIFEKAIAPDIAGAMVPNMIVQPLIENAIKHGIENSRNAGRVTLTVCRQDSRLAVTVVNDRREDAAPPEVRGNGVGFASVRARLRALYGNDYRLELAPTTNHKVKVVLEFPFRCTHERTQE
jgi:sensor histidine kinase YesM